MNVLAPERLEIIEDLRSTVRAALAAVDPGSGDEKTWRVLVEQIGLAGLLVPEGSGGLELGAAEVAALATEIGWGASRVPFLSHAVASTVLLRAGATEGDEFNVARELLAAVAAGEKRFAVAWAGDTATVSSAGEIAVASGVLAGVVDAPGADALLIGAMFEGEPVVCVVDQFNAMEQSALDPSRSLGAVDLAGVPCRILCVGAAAREALSIANRWTLLALAADQLGIARRSLHETVNYVGIRTQFGAVIGSFQAVKHRCTEVLLEVELAAALIDQAAAALDDECDPQDLVSTAFVQATTASLAATDALIQLHGGIGFTWEHMAHRFFRRARVNADLLGSLQDVRDAVAASAGI